MISKSWFKAILWMSGAALAPLASALTTDFKSDLQPEIWREDTLSPQFTVFSEKAAHPHKQIILSKRNVAPGDYRELVKTQLRLISTVRADLLAQYGIYNYAIAKAEHSNYKSGVKIDFYGSYITMRGAARSFLERQFIIGGTLYSMVFTNDSGDFERAKARADLDLIQPNLGRSVASEPGEVMATTDCRDCTLTTTLTSAGESVLGLDNTDISDPKCRGLDIDPEYAARRGQNGWGQKSADAILGCLCGAGDFAQSIFNSSYKLAEALAGALAAAPSTLRSMTLDQVKGAAANLATELWNDSGKFITALWDGFVYMAKHEINSFGCFNGIGRAKIVCSAIASAIASGYAIKYIFKAISLGRAALRGTKMSSAAAKAVDVLAEASETEEEVRKFSQIMAAATSAAARTGRAAAQMTSVTARAGSQAETESKPSRLSKLGNLSDATCKWLIHGIPIAIEKFKQLFASDLAHQ